MRELIPILLALSIVGTALGMWYAARRNGWFIAKSADDFSICRISPDTLCFQRDYPKYGIRGISTNHRGDGILHVEFNLSDRSDRREVKMQIDTQSVHLVRLYGTDYKLTEIPMCK